jgi:ubiquinone/menaquinone biosynthesis C-methylase UbiE
MDAGNQNWVNIFESVPTEQAASFERILVPGVLSPCARLLTEHLHPGIESVLDVGTGTGIVARFARDRLPMGARVTGIDISATMVAVARSLAEGHSWPAIEYHEASAMALPFGEASFDLVLSQHVLQFVADPGTAVSEMRRVLRPGGHLAAMVWDALARNPLFERTAAVLEQALGAEPAKAFATPWSMSGDSVARMFRAAALEEITTRDQSVIIHLANGAADLLWLLFFSIVGPRLRALTEDELADFAETLVAAAAPWTVKSSITAECSVVIIEACRGVR